MNNKKLIFLLIIVNITVLLFTTNNKNTIKNTHKQISTINMNLFNVDEEKIANISLNSPIYNKATNKFDSQKSTINLFTNENEIKYIASSDSSSISLSNKTILQDENVEFRLCKQDGCNYYLYADKLTINILSDLYLYFKGNIK